METLQAKQNNSETDLQRWLRETKTLNLTYAEILRRVGNIGQTPRKIYDLLDGDTNNQKATALFNRFRGASSETNRIVPLQTTSNWADMNYTTVTKPKVESEVKSKHNHEPLLVEKGTYIHTKTKKYSYQISDDVSSDKTSRINYTVLNDRRERYYDFSYSSAQINEQILSGVWIPENISKELQTKIDNYSNVITVDEFYHSKGKVNKSKAGDNGWTNLETITCKVKNVDGPHFYVTPFATSNCQLNVIGSANAILQNSTNPKQQFIEIYKYSGRALMLVDLNRQYVDKFKELFKDHIILEQSYESSNGSDMTIMIANFKGEVDYLDEDEDYDEEYEDDEYEEDEE